MGLWESVLASDDLSVVVTRHLSPPGVRALLLSCRKVSEFVERQLSLQKPLCCSPFCLRPGDLLSETNLDLPMHLISDANILSFMSAVSSGALPNLEAINLSHNQMTASGFRFLCESFSMLPDVNQLYLGSNDIGDEGMTVFASAIASGAMAQLTHLYLGENAIGDAGMTAFAEALKSPIGALGLCMFISLRSNNIGDVGMQAFSEAIRSGALPRLKTLWVNGNKIGDAGLTAFAQACRASGALGSCTFVDLGANDIGDVGMQPFCDAIRSGALPALQNVYLGANPGDDVPVEKALADRTQIHETTQ